MYSNEIEYSIYHPGFYDVYGGSRDVEKIINEEALNPRFDPYDPEHARLETDESTPVNALQSTQASMQTSARQNASQSQARAQQQSTQPAPQGLTQDQSNLLLGIVLAVCAWYYLK